MDNRRHDASRLPTSTRGLMVPDQPGLPKEPADRGRSDAGTVLTQLSRNANGAQSADPEQMQNEFADTIRRCWMAGESLNLVRPGPPHKLAAQR